MTTIANPVRPGTRVTLPKGTPYRSTNPRIDGVATTKRATTVEVHGSLDGGVQRWDERDTPRGTVLLPVISWVGGGGYWHRTQVTPALLEANGLPPLELPVLDKHARYDIGLGPDDEGLPSLEPGYTDQWEATQR